MQTDPDGHDFDVIIAGAGPVGAALALWLARGGISKSRILLVDGRSASDAHKDPRMLAISHGSKRLLEQLGVWHAQLGTPIRRIHVSQRGAFGRTVIDCAEYRVEALGYVVRYGDLVQQFHHALAHQALQVAEASRVQHIEEQPQGVKVDLDQGRTYRSAYAVHAEGGLFGAQTTQVVHRDYAQTALVAFVTCERPEVDVAWERFTSQGPIALLPISQGGKPGLSLVWCALPEQAQRRLALEEPLFLQELNAAFGNRLGRFTSVTGRRLFPLGLNAVEQIAHGREFAIGNAAQTLHPVAGQGLNLGLRDAYTLAEVLVADFEEPCACVAAFRHARRIDRGITLGLTDILPRLFTNPLAPIRIIRGAALVLLDLIPPARHIVARQMMNGRRERPPLREVRAPRQPVP